MTPDIAEVERALLALAPRDRAAVIQRGLSSLEDADGDQAGIDAAWRTEFRRRIDDIEKGDVELVPGEESQARVRALLAELHQ